MKGLKCSALKCLGREWRAIRRLPVSPSNSTTRCSRRTRLRERIPVATIGFLPDQSPIQSVPAGAKGLLSRSLLNFPVATNMTEPRNSLHQTIPSLPTGKPAEPELRGSK